MARPFLMVAAISGFISVALGAFAAHGLAHQISDRLLDVFNTATSYQMTQTLALAAVAILLQRKPDSKALVISGWAFIIGILLFSGSLYLLVLLNIPALGMVTPIGGVALLIGWSALLVHTLKTQLP